MNAQQRRTVLVGTLVGTLILGFLGYTMYWEPMQKLNQDLSKAEEELDLKQNELARFLKEKRNLASKRYVGLPFSPEEGVTNYQKYLRNIFKGAGVSEVPDIKAPTELDTRNQAGKKGKPGHLIRSYQVTAHLTWPQFLGFLNKFQETPLLHRIKTFHLEKPSGAKTGKLLNVTMTIETMSVARADPKVLPARPENLWGVDPRVQMLDSIAALVQAPTGWALILRGPGLLVPKTPEGRQYAELALRDPFYGPPPAAPPSTASVKKDKEKSSSSAANGLDVREFVVFVEYSGTEDPKTQAGDRKAYFRNTLVSPKAKDAYVLLSAKSPRNRFRIFDEARENVMVDGKVLRIEQRDIYFQVGDAIYAIHIGQDLATAMRNPLSEEEVEELGLLNGDEPLEKGSKQGKK